MEEQQADLKLDNLISEFKWLASFSPNKTNKEIQSILALSLKESSLIQLGAGTSVNKDVQGRIGDWVLKSFL